MVRDDGETSDCYRYNHLMAVFSTIDNPFLFFFFIVIKYKISCVSFHQWKI